ncbi:alkaline shock response membrane anchor protein AmaP [Lentilactobacillus buchneri]|nr:alkaline shock response membrane anchor protein AmaP [Lentilactobacillus buchneri]
MSIEGGDLLKNIYKLLYLIIIIILFPFAIFPLMATWARVTHTPFPIDLTAYDWVNRYAPLYLFWGSVALSLILVGLFLVIIFWHRPNTMYLYQKPTGQLIVTRKAISNFVLTALKQEPYIQDPKVTTRLSKHKIRIRVSGALLSSDQATQQGKEFIQTIETRLKTTLGLAPDKQISIKLNDFSQPDSHHSRVM